MSLDGLTKESVRFTNDVLCCLFFSYIYIYIYIIPTHSCILTLTVEEVVINNTKVHDPDLTFPVVTEQVR